MRYRDNDSISLASVFLPLDDTPPTIDNISRKWPSRATPISDYTQDARWATDEKLLIPANQRVIRSADFNKLADSICRIQLKLKELAGTAYLIDNGEVTSTIEDVSLFEATGLWASRKSNQEISVVKVTTETDVRFGYSYDPVDLMTELDPVHWWRFLEQGVGPGNGKTYKDSGSYRSDLIPFENQAVVDSPQYYKNNILNNSSQAVYANPYLGYAPVSGFTDGAFSISFWIKNITWDGDHGDEDNFMAWGAYGVGGFTFFLQNSGDAFAIKMRFFRSGGQTSAITLSTGFSNTSDWRKITVTVNSSGNVKCYTNGTLTCSTTTSDNLGLTAPSTSTDLRIPDVIRGLEWVTGTGIDDLAMFDYELTREQALQLYYVTSNYSRYSTPFAVSGDYTFHETINIPSILASGYSETSLTAVAQARIQDHGASSLWKTTTNSCINYANSSPYLFTSCYVLNNATQVQVYGKGFLPTPIYYERTKAWDISVNANLNQLINSANTGFVAYSYKTDHPTFQTKTQNVGLISTIGTTATTSKRVEINSFYNSTGTSTGLYPIGDTEGSKGTAGGYLARKRDDYSDTYVNVSSEYGISDFSVNVGMEFSINGYYFNQDLLDYIEVTANTYPLKSGIFLRLSKIDSQEPSYEDYPEYYGYLLRFNSLPVTAGMDGVAMNESIYSYSILKVSGDMLGAASGDLSRWWDSEASSRPNVDGTYHGKIQALYHSTSPLVGLINHSTTHTPVLTGNNYIYRFRIQGDTLYLERKISDTEWEDVIDPIVDTDPILPKDHAEYIPCGLYCKGVWDDTDSDNSSTPGYQSTLSLSNLKDWWEYKNTSKKVIIDVFLIKQNGDTTTPVVS